MAGRLILSFLDFEKALDTSLHEMPKCKLYGYGIGRKILKWIDSFLCDRQQSVVVNGVKLDWAPVCQVFPKAPFLDHCCSRYTLMILQMILTWNQDSLLMTVFATMKSKIVKTR